MSSEESADSVSEAMRKNLQKAPFGSVAPGATPTAKDVWSALGGPRGLVESVLPGLSFLVVYSLTGSLLWSVGAPVAASVGFIVTRFLQKSPLQPALVGFIGIVASAAVAVLSGRPENNFLLGLWVNAISLVVVLVSVLVRRPLVGYVAGLLVGDSDWYLDRAKRGMAQVATLLWATMFALRLIVQVPLYLAGAQQVTALATAKLVMGLPLYGLVLWLTWLLLRSVYRASQDPATDRI